MLCNGIGCRADVEKGVRYLEKAVASGDKSAQKYFDLYCPDSAWLCCKEDEAAEVSQGYIKRIHPISYAGVLLQSR